jgi:GAF domain-containing protein
MTDRPGPTQPDTRALQERIDQLERERARLVTMMEVLRDVTGAVHYRDILQVVTRRLGSLFGLDRCSVFLTARAGGPTVHLVASYEDPSIRNHVIDLARYPELRHAMESGQIAHIPDALADPALFSISQTLVARRVRSITVVPMLWQGHVIGTLFLRTYQDGPPLAEKDLEFCRVVADVTARALRMAHRLERLQARQGSQELLAADRERVALIAFLRRLLAGFTEREDGSGQGLLPKASAAELDRLVGVAMTALAREARGRQEPGEP